MCLQSVLDKKVKVEMTLLLGRYYISYMGLIFHGWIVVLKINLVNEEKGEDEKMLQFKMFVHGTTYTSNKCHVKSSIGTNT